MTSKLWRQVGLIGLLCCCVIVASLVAQETENANQVAAQDQERPTVTAERSRDDAAASVLSADEWQRVDEAVERALAWLAARQQEDGSFPSIELGQPGVTSLCGMAFLAHGHMPGEGQYGKQLERATDYMIESQKLNGLISRVGPEGATINRNVGHEVGEAAAYNHAIASLMLSELYGMSQTERSARIQEVVAKALSASLEMQRWAKTPEGDRGGWRYVGRPVYGTDSDLSVTGWELMFLRSARNAGFDVPKESIDESVAYIRRCFHETYGTFLYMQGKGDQDLRSRAMAGAGILALAHAGFHESQEAKKSADWLLKYNFNKYNQIEPFQQQWYIDRYHYSLFNSCQAMYQLGGSYWERFYPPAVQTLLDNQQRDGSWQAESHFNDGKFGNSYTTALVVMSLGAPNQFLPVFQR
jgi:hypothetical protein